MRKISVNCIDFDLFLFSKYRSFLMSIAIFMVVFHHLTIRTYDGLWGHLYGFLRVHGAIGVDVFFFVSAIGLTQSWDHSRTLIGFYKRRFLRIIPTYFVICIPIYLYTYRESIVEGSYGDFINHLFLISYFLKGDGYWYIAAILILYLLFPFFRVMIDRYGKMGGTILIIMWAVMCVYIFYKDYALFTNINAFLPRIPIFCFGCYIARYVLRARSVRINLHCVFFVMFVCLVLEGDFALSGSGMVYSFWPRFVYFPMAICLMIMILMMVNKDTARNILVIDEMGKYTLEIYLLNQLFIENCVKYFNDVFVGNIVGVIVTFIIAICINKIIKSVNFS